MTAQWITMVDQDGKPLDLDYSSIISIKSDASPKFHWDKEDLIIRFPPYQGLLVRQWGDG